MKLCAKSKNFTDFFNTSWTASYCLQNDRHDLQFSLNQSPLAISGWSLIAPKHGDIADAPYTGQSAQRELKWTKLTTSKPTMCYCALWNSTANLISGWSLSRFIEWLRSWVTIQKHPDRAFMQTMILTPFFKVDSVGERKSGNIRVVDFVNDKIIWKNKVERNSYSVLVDCYLKNSNLKNDRTQQIIWKN